MAVLEYKVERNQPGPKDLFWKVQVKVETSFLVWGSDREVLVPEDCWKKKARRRSLQ
jgi:hypothetical protein